MADEIGRQFREREKMYRDVFFWRTREKEEVGSNISRSQGRDFWLCLPLDATVLGHRRKGKVVVSPLGQGRKRDLKILVRKKKGKRNPHASLPRKGGRGGSTKGEEKPRGRGTGDHMDERGGRLLNALSFSKRRRGE